VSGTTDEPLHAPYDARVARRLLVFLVPYRRRVAAALGLLLALAAIAAFQPYLVKVAIDRHIATGDLAGLYGIALLYLGLLVLELGIAYGETYLTAWVGQRAMHDLREQLFERLQRLPVAFFDRQPIGRLVTRVTSDVEVLNELFSSGVVAVLSDALMLVAIAIMMFAVNTELAIITLLVVPLVLAISFPLRRRMRDAQREIRRQLARLNAYLQERVSGLVVVQLFRQERASADEFAGINREHQAAQLESVHYYALFYPLIELVGALAVALIVWYGGGEILRGALTFGALVAFLQYAQKFFRPIRDLAEKYNLLQAAMASGERLITLLDEPLPPTPTRDGQQLPQPRGEIVFDDVWFRYVSDPWVLRGVSFGVRPGEKLALVGPTGSGKTTCASLLCGFYEPTKGRVLLDGLDVREYPRAELSRRVGLVLQDVFLFSRPVADNVHLDSANVDEREVAAALTAIGANGFVAELPDGANTEVGERGRSLSTGQKQLVAFARVLAHDPPVLVLDEATSSVDSASEALIERAIGQLMADRSSIVIAHRLSTIRRVDQIVVVHKGTVCERGTHQQLLVREGIYARLYELQFADQEGRSQRLAAEPT
jgi:ATP-binding cassette subfamily B protein